MRVKGLGLGGVSGFTVLDNRLQVLFGGFVWVARGSKLLYGIYGFGFRVLTFGGAGWRWGLPLETS